MNYTVLITGSTEGIGAATAIEFAKRHYSVHILGRNKTKGEKVLEQLQSYNPEGNHLFFSADLSVKADVKRFLDNYLKEQSSLDILILNAGIHPKSNTLSRDGIDITFSIGYISRYMFAVRLNKLLSASKLGKVIHINGSVIGKIHFDELSNPRYNKMISVWQNSIGSALLVSNWKTFTNTNVEHIHWNPGIVNTQTVKSQSKVVQLLSKALGMVEANKAGECIASFVTENSEKNIGGNFYSKGKLKKKPKLHSDKALFKKLIEYSESFTNIN